MYVSPCFAGCSSNVTANNFTDCACVEVIIVGTVISTILLTVVITAMIVLVTITIIAQGPS